MINKNMNETTIRPASFFWKQMAFIFSQLNFALFSKRRPPEMTGAAFSSSENERETFLSAVHLH